MNDESDNNENFRCCLLKKLAESKITKEASDLCFNALNSQFISDLEVFSNIEVTEFNVAYLSKIGIKNIGSQTALILFHREAANSRNDKPTAFGS
jgi:hypothetical protein